MFLTWKSYWDDSDREVLVGWYRRVECCVGGIILTGEFWLNVTDWGMLVGWQ
jgi:hypothetical protein